jgi:DNA-directed RNA polymerase II subunit RPB2
MNFYKDTWEVIDNYFSTTPYFLTKHHLDSYNDFVANKVLNTVKVLNNSFIVIKNENNVKNTINTYIGGLEGKDIFINKPTIVENGEARLLYPNEARLRDMTYQSEVFANIHVVITQEVEGQNDKIYEKIFQNVKIGALPIMLHSKLCVLHDQPAEVLREMGECQYDQGGYFVVDGKEKVIVAQERIATNRIFISKSKDLKYSHEGLIRCTSIENPLFPKTTYLYVNDVRDNSDMVDNAISIAIPNVSRNIPIFILFRALGIESDKDILEYITYDVDDTINKNIIEFLRYSIIDNRGVYTQEEALNYISNFVEYSSLDKLKYILVNDLFPNVGISYKNKAMFLGHIVRKLVKVCLGVLPITDRDNYMYKRVDISGFLLANLFRDYYNQFRNFVRSKIDQAYHFGPWRESGIENLINKGNLNDIFNYHIIEDGLRKSLKGSWGKITSKEQQDYKDLENIKQEVVQDLNRFSYAGFISHLRRCNTPLDPTAVKMVGPHKLHTSQFGIMCPCESPDGASIGLLKNFAILAHVTFDIPVESIKECLREHGMLDIKDVPVPEVKSMTKILVNSNWVGVCRDAPKMYKLLKLLKRNALINTFTSVSWDIFNAEINILTESGRCCRPAYVVRDGNDLIVTKFLDDLKAKKLLWIDLIKGDLIDTKDFNPFFDGYISPKKIIEKKLNKTPKDLDEIIEILETTQAAIEYSDVEETNGHLIAIDYDELLKNSRKYTHCEIHASTMLSAVAVNTPFSDHNQAPRNIFSSGQCKQAIGVFATNYNNRIDTMVYTMNYAHRPITATRYGAYTNFNKMGNGQNLIVAVATYTGYNQEDSIIFNKTSVERGMFNLTYYKNMVDAEDENKRDNEAIRFANPLKLIEEGKNLTGMKFANYNKLDENGFPIVNSYIHEGDAIIGRCKVKTEYVEEENSKNNIFNNKIKREVYEDKSVIADKTVSGIIDKVFVYFDDHNKKKLKIRFRKNRDSAVGDKNCSRAGQKGVCGALIPEENLPFTKDGLKPDIIINPHAFPSRMTIGHLFESVLAKYGAMKGTFMDATPFNHNDYEPMFDMLEKDFGMERYGNEMMYNGFTGEQIATEIFIGPTFYQKLKHMVLDKINYRSTGPKTLRTRQPVHGRSVGGGLALGNMETAALIAHGISSFMKEGMMEKSDKYSYDVDNTTGNIGIVNRKNNIFKGYSGEDVVPSHDFSTLETPYAFKLLSQELMAMSLKPTIYTHDDYLSDEDDDNFDDVEVDPLSDDEDE